MQSIKFRTVDDYLTSFPEPVLLKLESLRAAIRKAAPDAVEIISYNMPAYKQHGVLVYFAGYKNHIGLYPTASGIRAFERDLSSYKFSKGAIRFPLDQRLPLALVTRIVKFRAKEDHDKAST